MSRELRTPLNSIIEAIISVLTGENDALSDAAKTALRSALDDGTAFLRTLQNILDLWRIKQGELPVEIQDVNFRELVDEAIFSVQDSIGRQAAAHRDGARRAVPAAAHRPRQAEPDPLPAARQRGQVHAARARSQIRGRVNEGKLAGRDRRTPASGSAPTTSSSSSTSSTRSTTPSSQKYRGAGLGLTLVRDLITLLEGEISVQSDIGRGTTGGAGDPAPERLSASSRPRSRPGSPA